jgi:hypothetical protein
MYISVANKKKKIINAMILQAILVSQLVKWNFINLNKAYPISPATKTVAARTQTIIHSKINQAQMLEAVETYHLKQGVNHIKVPIPQNLGTAKKSLHQKRLSMKASMIHVT